MEKEVTYCESCGAATTSSNGVCADCRDAELERHAEFVAHQIVSTIRARSEAK